MNSPGTSSSPKFINLKSINRHSPIELKEKMRKNYKAKVQNCRDMLINRFRGTINDTNLHNTITEIYKNMFDITNAPIDEEEMTVLEEIKEELVQEELKWWLVEYEKSLMDMDWSSLEQENNVICPICQRSNFILKDNFLLCILCKSSIKTQKTLAEVQKSILYSIEKHSAVCNHEFQFALLSELNDNHIYLICSRCAEMQMVI